MKDGGKHHRQQRFPAQKETIPERSAPFTDRLADGRPPRDLLVDDVPQRRVLRLADAGGLLLRSERIGLVADVDGSEDAARDHGFSGDEQRRKREEQTGAATDRRDPSPRREKRAGARR